MIVNEIYRYLGGDLVTADDKTIETALRSFRVSLVRNLTKKPESQNRRGVSASSPWYCQRRILYEVRDTERVPFAPRSRLAFLMGDTVEAFGIFLTRLAGVQILTPSLDGKQESVEADFDGRKVPGHIDMTVWDGGGAVIPVDWKSMADYGFKEFEQATRDPSAKWWTEERWGYLTQLRVYMKAKGSPYGVFVGVNKNTGHMAEMHVPPDPSWEVEMSGRVAAVAETIASGALPERPSWATVSLKAGLNERADGSKGAVEEIDHFRCGYCPFVKTCWTGFDLVPLKSAPKWRKAVEAEARTAAQAPTARKVVA